MEEVSDRIFYSAFRRIHRRWSGCVSCPICLLLNRAALMEEFVEGLDLIEEQVVIHHVLVVGSELG